MTTTLNKGQKKSARLLGRRQNGEVTVKSAVLGADVGRLQAIERLGADLVEQVSTLARRYAPVLLRFSLALVFIWFGTLKITGKSPVFNLIAATLPWFNPNFIVPALGVVEVALGIGLIFLSRARRLVLLVLSCHLIGTFLTFITAHEWVFQNGNPLLLTASGEFVLKNLVLISSALVLVGLCPSALAAPVENAAASESSAGKV
jgi:putative oxidoreductase